MPTVLPDAAALIPALDGLPAPWGLMALLLFATFVVHLILMNAVVGVAIITLTAKLRLFAPGVLLSDVSAHAAADTEHTPDVLLPKGVAFVVNFGIPPFLFMQCIYGEYIYTSSVLMAMWWLAVMLLVMLAYYGLYINMYKQGLSSSARTTALAIAVLLLLGNAFLFVNNITLLQHPEQWLAYASNAGGTLLNSTDPQVAPRYFHVILSCLAVGGLVLALPPAVRLRRLAREGGDPATALPLLEGKRKALRWFFFATLAQFPVGFWFFMSLPKPQRVFFMGGDVLATGLFALSFILSVLCLVTAWRERAWCTTWSTLLLIVMMAGMRTQLRGSMLEPYYDPHMRAVDLGPIFLFIGSLVLSAVAVAWLFKVYWRHRPAPGEEGFDPAECPPEYRNGDPDLIRKIVRMRERDALLVIEIASSGKEDDDEEAGGERKGGANA